MLQACVRNIRWLVRHLIITQVSCNENTVSHENIIIGRLIRSAHAACNQKQFEGQHTDFIICMMMLSQTIFSAIGEHINIRMSATPHHKKLENTPKKHFWTSYFDEVASWLHSLITRNCWLKLTTWFTFTSFMDQMPKTAHKFAMYGKESCVYMWKLFIGANWWL